MLQVIQNSRIVLFAWFVCSSSSLIHLCYFTCPYPIAYLVIHGYLEEKSGLLGEIIGAFGEFLVDLLMVPALPICIDIRHYHCLSNGIQLASALIV